MTAALASVGGLSGVRRPSSLREVLCLGGGVGSWLRQQPLRCRTRPLPPPLAVHGRPCRARVPPDASAVGLTSTSAAHSTHGRAEGTLLPLGISSRETHLHRLFCMLSFPSVYIWWRVDRAWSHEQGLPLLSHSDDTRSCGGLGGGLAACALQLVGLISVSSLRGRSRFGARESGARMMRCELRCSSCRVLELQRGTVHVVARGRVLAGFFGTYGTSSSILHTILE